MKKSDNCITKAKQKYFTLNWTGDLRKHPSAKSPRRRVPRRVLTFRRQIVQKKKECSSSPWIFFWGGYYVKTCQATTCTVTRIANCVSLKFFAFCPLADQHAARCVKRSLTCFYPQGSWPSTLPSCVLPSTKTGGKGKWGLGMDGGVADVRE